jgi:hypothetical protein
MTYEELGKLAVRMTQAQLKCEAWLEAEAKELRMRSAQEAPDYAEYNALVTEFFSNARIAATVIQGQPN